jgi:glucose-6-phosphate 1-epimerase
MSTSIEALNARFGITAVAEIRAGRGGLPVVQVFAEGATAEVYFQGAQVTSWRPAGGEEVIFLSEQSLFQDGKAIRGGIPICFPWFRAKDDDPKAPSHGVVRTRAWELSAVERVGEKVRVVFALESDDATRKWWPGDFRVEHRILIGIELELELVVSNTGGSPMRFAEALHTYYRVADAEQVLVRGLDGVTYLDNMDGNKEKVQAGDVHFTGPTDSAYIKTAGAVELLDPVLKRSILLEKGSSATTVVWNPWAENAKKLADLGDEEWKQMACVEASNILGEAVELAPGAVHSMTAKISVACGR